MMKAAKRLYDAAERLSPVHGSIQNQDFLLSWRVPDDTIRWVRGAAEWLHDAAAAGVSLRVFESGLAVSLFRDKSTRTRYAFRAGANLLGLATEELDEGTSQIAHGETVRETAAMIGFLTEAIGIRDDMFLGEGHAYMQHVAASLAEAARAGALIGRPSVVNLQCDLDHPTQALADLVHLSRTFGGVEHLRGKRVAVTWASSPSYGKPLSVPQGALALFTRFGMDVVLAHPEGYNLADEPLAVAAQHAASSGGSLRVVHDMDEAFRGADVVYPKSWAPMWAMQERTRVARARAGVWGEGRRRRSEAPNVQPDPKAAERRLETLEKEALAQNEKHAGWECNEAKMALTKNGDALYMHCLPADVSGVSCASGEVSQGVFERHRLSTYKQAGYKPFVVAAILLATRFAHPNAVLRALADGASPRRRFTGADR